MTKHRKFPELTKGVRIEYKDKNEATRAGKILARTGNTLTVIIGTKYTKGLNSKYRIPVENVIGYWKNKVKASPANMIKLE